jgi:hypothetical protein
MARPRLLVALACTTGLVLLSGLCTMQLTVVPTEQATSGGRRLSTNGVGRPGPPGAQCELFGWGRTVSSELLQSLTACPSGRCYTPQHMTRAMLGSLQPDAIR